MRIYQTGSKKTCTNVFIVIEWLDGSWSTTQVELLNNYFLTKWVKALKTKEPTNTEIGKFIRKVLQNEFTISPLSLQMLFVADRANHLDSEIIPAIENNTIVISDRYTFSTIAFWSLQIDRDYLIELNKKFRKPDITFILKLNPEECINRIIKRWNKIELFEKSSVLSKVWENYEYLLNTSDNCYLIDASKKPEEVHEIIIKTIIEKLKV